MAYEVKRTIDMVDELWDEHQEINNLDGSAIAGFGMLVSARLRAVLDEYEERANEADA